MSAANRSAKPMAGGAMRWKIARRPAARVKKHGSRRIHHFVLGTGESDFSCLANGLRVAITIADVCTRAEEQGLRRPGAQRYVYVI